MVSGSVTKHCQGWDRRPADVIEMTADAAPCGAIPITGEWAYGPWPEGVPVQIHGMDQDPFFALEGDIVAARELVQTAGSALAELSCSSPLIVRLAIAASRAGLPGLRM